MLGIGPLGFPRLYSTREAKSQAATMVGVKTQYGHVVTVTVCVNCPCESSSLIVSDGVDCWWIDLETKKDQRVEAGTMGGSWVVYPRKTLLDLP